MTSLNNIKRIKCTNKENNEYIELLEYILFFNDEDDKYIVFKFKNNLDQYLYGFTFELLQYNENNKLIEKSELTCRDIKVNNLESFVPDKKHKLNKDCDHIGINIIKANFERISLDHGVTTEVKFDFKEYKENQEKTDAVVAKKSKRERKEATTEIKEAKVEYTQTKIVDITKQNTSNKPWILGTILSLILIVLTFMTSDYSYKLGQSVFYCDAYYSITSENECSLVLCETTSNYFTIPDSISDGENTYIVTNVKAGAFSGNKSIQSIVIATTNEITLKQSSFRGCTSLTTISSSNAGVVNVNSYAFIGCDALNSINLPNGVISKNAFELPDDGFAFFGFNKVSSSVTAFYQLIRGASSNADIELSNAICYKTLSNATEFFKINSDSSLSSQVW